MKIYWSLNQVPELADLSPSGRLLIFRKCLHRYKGWRFVWIMLLCAFLGHITGEFISGQMRLRGIDEWRGVSSDNVEFIVFLLCCAVGGVITNHVLIHRMRPHFREYIPVHSEKPVG